MDRYLLALATNRRSLLFSQYAHGNVAAVDAIKASADRHAANVLPVIEDIRAAGSGTLEGIARNSTRGASRRSAAGNGTRLRCATFWYGVRPLRAGSSRRPSCGEN